ncbi:MAG TPA: hypothetical protein VJA26_17735 [Gammaproteobacteria bacterium]|nr:hypothetical protein [Gammaproteobacteria bacterium]
MTKQDSSEPQQSERLSITPQEQILGLVNNYRQASRAGAAAQLQIADHLAEAPLHVDDCRYFFGEQQACR